jgi:hypothetical protein
VVGIDEKLDRGTKGMMRGKCAVIKTDETELVPPFRTLR